MAMDKKMKIPIGKLSERSGASTDTIRYYEKLGVLGKADRAANGYRVYGEEALRVLLFVRRAKVMNFTLEEIKDLLTMSDDNHPSSCGDILAMVDNKISAFRQEIEDTQLVLKSLEHFAEDCPGGQEPTVKCPFIDYLGNREDQV